MTAVDEEHLRPGAALTVRNLVVRYRTGGRTLEAVSDVSLDVLEGETLGLVGESGCGKSTLGRAISGHLMPASGSIDFGGTDLARLGGKALRQARTSLQMIFQDPRSSLNPRRQVEAIVGEGLAIQGVGQRERQQRVRDIMEAVGLTYEPQLRRRRDQFSGGQCQRIGLARALVMDPKMLICDEPVSALDVSVQAQTLNLLVDMKARYGPSMIFISHDLGVVRHISSRVAVMYLGKLCEVGPVTEIFARPAHHYTRTLLTSVPKVRTDEARSRVAPPAEADALAEVPSPFDPPSGCRFRTRCPAADGLCAAEVPQLRQVGPGQFAACHHPVVET